jgi:hypothetical protein
VQYLSRILPVVVFITYFSLLSRIFKCSICHVFSLLSYLSRTSPCCHVSLSAVFVTYSPCCRICHVLQIVTYIRTDRHSKVTEHACSAFHYEHSKTTQIHSKKKNVIFTSSSRHKYLYKLFRFPPQSLKAGSTHHILGSLYTTNDLYDVKQQK